MVLPPSDKCFLFHAAKHLIIESRTGRHVLIDLGLAPIGRLKYLKGKLPLLQFKKRDAASWNLLSILIPTKLLLLKFTLRPDTSLKHLKKDFMAQRLLQDASSIKSGSFAYCRSETSHYKKFHYFLGLFS